ncbi:hypothetical protein CRG98_043229 [Punica granatum]|uniref:Uncharacterized protein n=1 Tax=Punica granatum TaxID=22663 RepID=A0A2I0HXX5_PUNGR|nr:hypothetical protein CRG98_043229 [Punica granatum]
MELGDHARPDSSSRTSRPSSRDGGRVSLDPPRVKHDLLVSFKVGSRILDNRPGARPVPRISRGSIDPLLPFVRLDPTPGSLNPRRCAHPNFNLVGARNTRAYAT